MSFSKDFLWGAATAAYQIEGGARDDGKGESIWDVFSHTPGKTFLGQTGDVACDHYHRYPEDIALMKELGIQAYRFSLSWARLFPDGTGKRNEAGFDYYKRILELLQENDIKPFITLYHWDLPYALHCKGGWLNDDIADWFGDYAAAVSEAFSPYCSSFMTFNEPQVFAGCGYEEGKLAPGYKLAPRELLHIGHNILRAHGRAVTALRQNSSKPIEIGFVSATSPLMPTGSTAADIEAARSAYFACDGYRFLFDASYWNDTIVFGKYPEGLTNALSDIMPEITAEDMKSISQPIDFLGINIYWGNEVVTENGVAVTAPYKDGFTRTSTDWRVTPDALYWGTKFFGERYNLPLYITENGMSAHDTVSLDGYVHDPNRIDYITRYLIGLKRAAEEGAPIKGYFVWSLLDNYEWDRGYDERFGLVYIDYQTLERIPKDSAHYYKAVIKMNGECI